LYIRLRLSGAYYYMTTSRWCAISYDYFLLLSEGRLWDYIAFYLPASTKIDYFKQLNMSTIENDTVGASSIGLTLGYNPELSHLFVVLFLFLYKLSANNPYDILILLFFNNIMIYFMTFGIKTYRKIPKILTEINISPISICLAVQINLSFMMQSFERWLCPRKDRPLCIVVLETNFDFTNPRMIMHFLCMNNSFFLVLNKVMMTNVLTLSICETKEVWKLGSESL
jgi:hypothetical protein